MRASSNMCERSPSWRARLKQRLYVIWACIFDENGHTRPTHTSPKQSGYTLKNGQLSCVILNVIKTITNLAHCLRFRRFRAQEYHMKYENKDIINPRSFSVMLEYYHETEGL